MKISECSTSIHDSSSDWTTQIRTDSTECLTGLTAGDFNGRRQGRSGDVLSDCIRKAVYVGWEEQGGCPLCYGA